jgi:hypothetical protein
MEINLDEEFIELVGQTNSFTEALEIQQKRIIERERENNESNKKQLDGVL